VPSTTVPPGWSCPLASAASMMASAARSFTEPPGFMNSALPRISQPVRSLRRFRRISGVLTMAAAKPCRMVMVECSWGIPVRSGDQPACARGAIGAYVEPLQCLVQGGDLPDDQQGRRGNACLGGALREVLQRAADHLLVAARAVRHQC